MTNQFEVRFGDEDEDNYINNEPFLPDRKLKPKNQPHYEFSTSPEPSHQTPQSFDDIPVKGRRPSTYGVTKQRTPVWEQPAKQGNTSKKSNKPIGRWDKLYPDDDRQSLNDGQQNTRRSELANDQDLPTGPHREIFYKAQPSYLLTRYQKIVANIFKFLPNKDMYRSSRVCRVWFNCARAEKKRRKFVEADCYTVELKVSNAMDQETREQDLAIELHYLMTSIYVEPKYILAFMTYRTLTEIPDILFNVMPRYSMTTIVASSQGVFGKKRNGETELFDASNEECFSTLFVPKFDGFQILQYSANDLTRLRFSEDLLRGAGLDKWYERKHIKCIYLFASKHKSVGFAAEVSRFQAQFYDAVAYHCAFVGASVDFAQQGVRTVDVKRTDIEMKLHEIENDVKGLIFTGENLEVYTVVIDKHRDSVGAKLMELSMVLARDNRKCELFAICFVGKDAEFDLLFLKTFKERFPNIRLAGLKVAGHVFGCDYNSEVNLKTSVKPAIKLGDVFVLTIFRIKMENAPGQNERGPFNTGLGLRLLQGYKLA